MRETVIASVCGIEKEAKFGAPVSSVLPEEVDGRPVLGAVMDNMLVPLGTPLAWDVDVSPVTIASPSGSNIYQASLSFALAKCAAKLYPKGRFHVRNSIGRALFFSLDLPEDDTDGMDAAAIAISSELDALIERDVPIVTDLVSYRDAVDIFGEAERMDELHILKHRNPPAVLLTRCEDFVALNQVPLVRRTGLLGLYDLQPADGGFLLRMPSDLSPDAVTPIPDVSHYMREFADRESWGEAVGVRTVGDLNATILEGRFDDFVRAAESLHRRSLCAIADKIVAKKPGVRLVLVAGPSSAGKTTTAHRLANELRACGKRVLIMSTDDYFVGDARNPRDENGNLDYECVGAVDQDLLAADLNALFIGEKVHLRKFDFIKHEGNDADAATSLPEGGIVLLEGIHALNPELTEGIDDSLKFRVYLNAYTQIAIDCCNRISTRDTRLLRRLIRDYRTRGMSPKDTIAMWPKVMAGEYKWIFPFQKYADATFNSALEYELAVLKPYAGPLLDLVKPWDPEFLVVRRLSGILHNVAVSPSNAVPGDSILRETIGGSQLDY